MGGCGKGKGTGTYRVNREREPEIADLQDASAVHREEDVGRLEIAVNEPASVHELHALQRTANGGFEGKWMAYAGRLEWGRNRAGFGGPEGSDGSPKVGARVDMPIEWRCCRRLDANWRGE